MDNNSKTLSVKQMQETLQVGRVTAYRLANSKGFPSFRIGKKILIDREGLKAWMKQQQDRRGEYAPVNR